MARDQRELLEHLEEQMAFLESSNASFDAGNRAEAKRLALIIRLLLHNTSRSHALINQLGLENKLEWVDSAGTPDPDNLLSQWKLIYLKFEGSSVTYEPHLGNYGGRTGKIRLRNGGFARAGSLIPFGDWWENAVIKDGDGTLFTRRRMVLALANEEGGAHVDPNAKADYNALAKANSIGWSFEAGGQGPQPIMENPVYPAVRQISYEVLESLREQQHLIR